MKVKKSFPLIIMLRNEDISDRIIQKFVIF